MASLVTQSKILKLSPEGIETFLDQLRQKGRSGATAEKYRHDLTALYDFLPEEKVLDKNTLPNWQTSMMEEGYATRTVNSRISAANSFLDSLGRRDLQLISLERPDDIQPELTRAEYLRLLSAAKALEKERLYLWVKIFGSMGLPVQGLSRITREAVEHGFVSDGDERYRISTGLQKELHAYANREGIQTGALFLAKNGQPIRRTYVTDSIRALGREARVPEEKATPRCLQRMYRATQEEISSHIARLVEQSYAHLLETEQMTIGWEQTDR